MEIQATPKHMFLRKSSLGIVFSTQEYRGKLYFDIRYYRLRRLTKKVQRWCPTPKGIRVELGEVEALLDVLAAYLESELGLKLEVTRAR